MSFSAYANYFFDGAATEATLVPVTATAVAASNLPNRSSLHAIGYGFISAKTSALHPINEGISP